MNKIFTAIMTGMLMLSPAMAQDDVSPVTSGSTSPITSSDATPYIPETLEVTGVAIVSTPKTDPRDPKGPKLGSSAIVNGRIWWEGTTLKIRKDDNSWVTLTLTKVEMIKGKGGVLTFTIELTRHQNKPTFQVAIKKSTSWGLTKTN